MAGISELRLLPSYLIILPLLRVAINFGDFGSKFDGVLTFCLEFKGKLPNFC